ncbi:2-amino-4-hydroxy-6-hydroxymethyldihydropteridine diphosphokinase [Clostridium algidicarnis]|uniref:2-amino-4-hydroxy-6- hydroxymethyldihydropteridine diphosphokinase n=1 Tax=Clostridium algidicarnis TaxID=37659 RepID=UPI001C0E57D7|nr:2-amino-4-hydroxy-6-hydroxymethyldihydropteridine diphosphokinase [Clostridium algidicarnis]MBU3193054.1 2-amino-4-hydroxy-6-hydroxymethyldihydropteridine diphosphokinase [Clostridium algidicarnis]MBU3196297.1 2-amino-4-hydroxy-6-hydroxymethyldihydropteridine diphosphokinase [Clostridium algidicarnis]MBU3204167.1 2-amino-4-hydroxy-6-hydroxymethyldihydropteridine diphosphokinase [Clostridium algidicarnis]MBU3212321.1 2-amino-4-hydroxy-6-hydroxymethyldihydropteridine diphosphokinase [Clostridi
MNKIYLGLGSNIGDTKKNIDTAISMLSKKVNIKDKSSYYETEPVGFKDQPWFLNIVIEGETNLRVEELLNFTQSVESDMKRVKTFLNGPRIIDVDILLYNDVNIASERLTVPHPRMHERAFVMVPLFELSKDLIINDISIEDIIKNLKGKETIKRV